MVDPSIVLPVKSLLLTEEEDFRNTANLWACPSSERSEVKSDESQGIPCISFSCMLQVCQNEKGIVVSGLSQSLTAEPSILFLIAGMQYIDIWHRKAADAKDFTSAASAFWLNRKSRGIIPMPAGMPEHRR